MVNQTHSNKFFNIKFGDNLCVFDILSTSDV